MEDGWQPFKGFSDGKEFDLGQYRREQPGTPNVGFRFYSDQVMYEVQLNDAGKEWVKRFFPGISFSLNIEDATLEPPC